MKGVCVRAGGMHTVYDANAKQSISLVVRGMGGQQPAVCAGQALVPYFNYYYVSSEEWEALGC